MTDALDEFVDSLRDEIDALRAALELVRGRIHELDPATRRFIHVLQAAIAVYDREWENQ